MRNKGFSTAGRSNGRDVSHLDGSVEKGDGIEQWFPVGKIGDVQQVLRHKSVGSFESGLDALRRLSCELD